MAFVCRTIGLAALIAAAPTFAQVEPVPKGSYQADALGRLELEPSAERDRLAVYAVDGGPCGFQPRKRVLEGEFQGHVMVGQLTVCLTGESCPATDTLPILAIFNPEDRSLTAYVRLQAGCQAPVLGQGGLLVMQPVAGNTPPVRVGPVASAAAMARPVKRSLEGAKESLGRGNELMVRNDWKGAIEALELSVYHIEGLDPRVYRDESLWLTYLSLGTSLCKDKQPQKAMEALQKARTSNPRHPSIYYFMACAYSQLKDKKQALRHLTLALDYGLGIQRGSEERELDELLASDIETSTKYHELIRRAYENQEKGTQKAFDQPDKGAAGKRPIPGP